MDKDKTTDAAAQTTVDRTSDTEVVVTRHFDAPARAVWAAWTKPELMRRWWIPKSMGMTLLSCEMDVRVGGSYRFEIKHPAVEHPMAFFGHYTEVVPNARLVWTNEESEAGAVTTVTLAEVNGRTRLVLHEVYPSKAALDENMGSIMPEQFVQLDGLLAAMGDS
jgi:uncharacterized protein YndB with AHSA1/START domain